MTLTYEIITAQRVNYKTSDMFSIVISKSFLSGKLLPFNMPQSNDILFDLIQAENQVEFKNLGLNERQPFDDTFWQQKDTILIPYFPYFANCNGYDKHMIIYQYLENLEKCQLKLPEETLLVNSIPISGLYPIADECNYKLTCTYEEQYDIVYKGTKWYDTENSILFYITQDYLTLEEFIKEKNDSSGFFSQILQDKKGDLIPVKFKSIGKKSGYIPNTGTFFGTIPFLVAHFFVYFIYQIQMFSVDNVFNQYDVTIITPEEKKKIEQGRSGLMLCIMGLFFMYYGACLQIPLPSTEYENRSVSWIGYNYTKDKSLEIIYRSLDNMQFSDQFYFIGTITTFGILFFVIGMTIMLRTQYIFFSDPVIYPMITFYYFIVHPTKWLMIYFWSKFDLWKLVDQENGNQQLESIDDILNQERENIEQIMEQEEIREHFVKQNKEWLIKNLTEYLTPESFLENNEYLLNLYQKLIEDENQEEKEKRRKGMQDKKKQELQRLKDKVNANNKKNNEQNYENLILCSKAIQQKLMEIFL
ncbi:hypothetical protein IMG5_148370 [Ichthyophthirius multifiliis]|uniref:Transmembrane protein n=1 Tax=Ichthyophthirius multifiliis TaxID=5932 RepID=G0QYA5_ICHMU|nr:hypothetical protein IMG5_148370 [Ichthyophthirius multifiliis]EGR29809.1 hypothetical protein IMG5_148370 [Ichthyophthirius multifiliis]|eukprot:XP_004031045.1 hypothetical protein IMG5_148370 [Ichthyophthirius multifiliis]